MVSLLQQDAVPIPGYRLIRYIGRGGFGEVWEAEAPGGLPKAIKMAPMEHNEAAISCRELEGLRKMRSIRHPYLLSIERFEVIDRYLVIVMELAERNLAERYSECIDEGKAGIPREELLSYLREAAEVLDLMNQRHELQHLDVKPENLFLSGGHVKVADFGLVQPRNTEMSRSALAISPPYAPPELFDGRIEPTADQYSLAVTYQELLTGTRPYVSSDVRELILSHLRGRPDVSEVPPGDRPVLARAYQRDPAARYASCLEFVEALERAAAFGAPQISPKILKTEPTRVLGPAPKKEHEPLAPMVAPVKKRRATVKTAAVTVPLETRTKPIDSSKITRTLNLEPEYNRATFLAFLPLEIYAHKLRGFIDAMGAEIVSCAEDKTILRFGAKRWFKIRDPRGVFLEIETFTRNPYNGFRIVDVNVWSSRRDVDAAEMSRRAMLLIRCLKAYLMASDAQAAPILLPEAVLRAEIFG